jgi:hypothetical protein
VRKKRRPDPLQEFLAAFGIFTLGVHLVINQLPRTAMRGGTALTGLMLREARAQVG